MTLTKKEQAEKKKIDRKVSGGKKVTRKEIMRGLELVVKSRAGITKATGS